MTKLARTTLRKQTRRAELLLDFLRCRSTTLNMLLIEFLRRGFGDQKETKRKRKGHRWSLEEMDQFCFLRSASIVIIKVITQAHELLE